MFSFGWRITLPARPPLFSSTTLSHRLNVPLPPPPPTQSALLPPGPRMRSAWACEDGDAIGVNAVQVGNPRLISVKPSNADHVFDDTEEDMALRVPSDAAGASVGAACAACQCLSRLRTPLTPCRIPAQGNDVPADGFAADDDDDAGGANTMSRASSELASALKRQPAPATSSAQDDAAYDAMFEVRLGAVRFLVRATSFL